MTKKPKRTQASDLASKSPDAQDACKPVTSRTRAKSREASDTPQAMAMLDPYLTTTHPFIRAVADNVTGHYELFWRPRQRKTKAKDKATLAANVLTIFANLAKVIVEGRNPPTVGVSLRAAKQRHTRYTPKGLSGLPRTVETLSEHKAGLSLRKSKQKGAASAMIADAAFSANLRRYATKPGTLDACFGESDAPRETIWLTKVAERDYVAGTISRELIDYAETDETLRLREQMRTINRALRNADMAFEQGRGPIALTRPRHLRRHFNSEDGGYRFDRGGRLFGGWWQTLESEQRHAIRLDGERIADLDFSAMFLRLAYIEAGHALPEAEDDLYALPGFTDHREGVKTVVNAMLFRTSPMTRLPRGSKDLLPRGTVCGQLREAILDAHPRAAGVFEKGVGLRLMYLESEILVAAMLRLIESGVAAVLPMHDGLMCPESKAAVVAAAMHEASAAVVGRSLPVKPKEVPAKNHVPPIG